MRKLPTLLTALAIVMFVWPEPAALAGEKHPPDQNPAVQQEAYEVRKFSKHVREAIEKSMSFSNADLYPDAIAILKDAQAEFELNPYETATIHQILGSALYELDDYDGAIFAFENAIASSGLLPNEASNLRVNIAQLLIVNGKPAQGAQMLEDWAKNGGEIKSKHIEYLWQAWSQTEQYDRALPWAEKWFDAASPKERKHFDLLNFIYRILNMPAKQEDIVKQMITRWPEDKNLWNVWKSLLASGGREKEAFEVHKMLYFGGALDTQQEFETVVQYYSYYDMPYQAAKILERELNAGTIKETPTKLAQLSNLYRQAREYKLAITALEKTAKSANKAKPYAYLGEALYKENQCDKVETAFKKAMQLGYDQGKSWMLIASCRYDDAATEVKPKCPYTAADEKNLAWSAKRTAAAAFANVPSSSEEARIAKKWMNFIAGEKSNLVHRCKREIDTRRQNCRDEIRRYFQADSWDNFELSKSCEVFIPRFDKEFRKGVKKLKPKQNSLIQAFSPQHKQ